MIKIVRQPRPEDGVEYKDGEKFPWMRLGKAVLWALYRTEQTRKFFEGGDPSEADWFTNLHEIRMKLATGALTAWGQRDWLAPHEEIPAIDWTTRPVTYYDMKLVYRPFEVIRVRRDNVFKIWPPLGEKPDVLTDANPKSGPGRPNEFDWEEILAMARQEPRHLSGSKVAEVLIARCSEAGGQAPSKSRLREKLKTWGWPAIADN